MNKKETRIITFIGIFYVLLGATSILTSIYQKNPNQVFWGCYICSLLLGIGMLTKRGYLIGSQIAILGIPLLAWNIDFFHYLITNTPLWGITDYMFTGSFSFPRLLSLQHIITIPIGIYALSRIKTKDFDFWKASFLQVALLFVIVLIRTDPSANINCVFAPCFPLRFNLPYYIEWFITFYAMIIIMNFILWKLPFTHKKKS